MNFDLSFERDYTHPIERVWRALTDPQKLGQWLMETDFVPEVGRDFTMTCADGEGGLFRHKCSVLSIDPPRSMVWSWTLDGRFALDETTVEFQLAEQDGGTRLTVRHSGTGQEAAINSYRGGWRIKLENLAASIA